MSFSKFLQLEGFNLFLYSLLKSFWVCKFSSYQQQMAGLEYFFKLLLGQILPINRKIDPVACWLAMMVMFITIWHVLVA